MKILCKVSFALSIIFLAVTVATTLMCSFFNKYVIIGSLGTSESIAIFTALSVFFFIVYILAKRVNKKFFVIFSVVLLILAEIIVLLIGFLPEYQYTTHVSNDKKHVVLVQEKSTNAEVSIQFYKKISAGIYEPVYIATITSDKKDEYSLGDYTVMFDNDYIRFSVPLVSSTEFLVSYSK